MTQLTLAYRVVADDSLGTEKGLSARAGGVTASELHAIAQGGRSTQRRILNDKLNGATFKGNAHTRRGHEREDFLIDWASETVAPCAGNIALLGHGTILWLLATPDGLGDGFGVEVKSHDHKWDRDDIPAEHYDQMQGGMAVTGFDRWLYVWEVMGEDGTPTLDEPHFLWVPRDEKRIARLTSEAEKFIAWRDAGAPASDDDLPDEVDEALAVIAEADDIIAPHKKAREAALKVVRAHAEATADEHGSKGAGTRGSYTYSVTTKPVLDEDAWALAEPDTYAEWLAARDAIVAQEAAAFALYQRDEISSRLNTSKTKDAAA
ncbi:hypothetical protein QE375_001626 [Microbacterium foliorum]|uniref:YqaJ viral recombinase domain-containing protein n=1 Tax=Microbacterium foliorum TaxID=104336 RepID=A0ABU1HPU5_9MICO|nr:YqaJ viral recombinase family protein [Microbacterium foliorum]MDR6142072.1 hypothetical protein [Microbacterium foliorum]